MKIVFLEETVSNKVHCNLREHYGDHKVYNRLILVAFTHSLTKVKEQSYFLYFLLIFIHFFPLTHVIANEHPDVCDNAFYVINHWPKINVRENRRENRE